MTWENIKIKQSTVEGRWILFFVLCILAGILGDHLNRCGQAILYIENLDGVSLVIIQIQGTIDTLSIAILSLLGGRVSESYMGIPLIDFILNRRPRCLKQRRIINSLIILLSINVCFHLLKWYNTVLALFLVSEGLVCFSVKEIYEVFSGHIELRNEIECYLLGQMEIGTHSNKLNLLHKFCDEWKSKIVNQSEPEFKSYQNTFNVIFQKFFLDKTTNSRTELQKCIYDVICVLLHSEYSALKKKGLCFVREIYSKAWSCILIDKNATLGFSDGFYLFHTIGDELQEAIEQLPVADVERELQWFTTAEYVLLVSYWSAGGAERQTDRQKELQTLNYFMRVMGYYIAKNKNQEWHSFIWEKPLAYLRFPIVCPENKQDEMNQQQSTMLFCYAVSLVNFNMLDILGNSLYAQAIPRLYHPVDKYNALLVLKIHCYIYYLADYESNTCISDDTQKACKTFLRSDKIRQAFSGFLRSVSSYKEIFNQDLEKLLLRQLEGFELFPTGATAKTMIMEDVVRNYVLFITLYLFGEHDPYYLMDQVLSDEVVKYQLPFYLEKSAVTINQIDSFLTLLSASEGYPHQEKAQELYMALEQKTKLRLKKIELSEAAQQSQEEKSGSVEAAESQIRQYICEKFSPLISEEAKGGDIHRVNCFQMNILSNMSVENLLLEHLNDIASGLVDGICNDLCKTGFLQTVKRSDFQDDSEYIDYLKKSNAGIVLGSQWSFHAKRYEDQKSIDCYFEERTTIFSGFVNRGILLRDKSLQIYVENVHIFVRPFSIEDSNARRDPERGVYIYNVSGIDLEFEEDELANFLKQKRRIVDVEIQLLIKKDERNKGDLLLNDSMNTVSWL